MSLSADPKYIDDSDFSKLQRSKLYIGDLMFTYIGANIGDVALINENDKYYLAPNVARIRSNKNVLNHFFIIQYFNIPTFLNQEIYGYIASSSQPALSMESIRKFKINLPSFIEQQKIASFLTLIDDKLQTFKKKKILLEQYKKGMMQKIFSHEVRFKDDNGAAFPKWVKKKLGEVCEIIAGGTPDTSNDAYWNGNIQWFTPTEIKGSFVSKSLRTITELGLKKSSAKLLPKGTILLTTRATIGEASIALEECTTNQGFQSLVVNENNNNIYLFNWIKVNKHELVKRANGSTFSEISKSKIEQIVIPSPCLEEQTKIANFLSAIDDKINLCNAQIEKTEQWKKGLLQKMFV